jgi:hypothetical protein
VEQRGGRTPEALDASRVGARKGGVESAEGVDDIGALAQLT